MENGIKVFIVEDEIITVATMQQSLEEAGYTVCGNADEAELGFELIKKTEPDIIMLDINLIGEKDGIWLAEQINKTLKIPFIFLTSLGDKNSIEKAVRTRPYGYLLKPFEDEDIFESINVALANFSKNDVASPPNSSSQHKDLPETAPIKNAIFIKHNNLYSKVKFKEILFIESDKNYIDVLTDHKKFTIRTSLKDMSANLPKGQFLQINRSCIVNLDRVDSYGKDNVNIKKHELLLSDNYKEVFLKSIKTYKESEF